MEESQKRKERLKAMRIEQQQQQQQQPQPQPQQQQQEQTLINTPLGNPLADNQQQQSTPLPRFDFYTDPLAAFSSHKPPPSRPCPSPSPPGSRNAEMSHSGAHQFQNSYSQNVHQGGVPYNNTCSSVSPMGVRSPYHGPFPVQQGSPDFSYSPNRGPQIYSSPTPGSGRGGNPYPVHQGSPGFSSPPYRGPQIYNCPAPGSGRGGSPYPVHHGSPNFVPHTQGRGPWPNSNMPPPGPGPGRGRGRGWWDGGASSGSRNSGGRGRGHGSDGQGRSYYLKSMVQDPWESLTPVIWESHDDGVSFYSWGSIKITSSAKSNRGSFRNAKKARVHEKSKTGPSLAEFLAAAADEEDVDNTGTT